MKETIAHVLLGAVTALLLAGAVLVVQVADSDAETVTAPYGYFSLRYQITDMESVEYSVVDFGDGTVVDGRWEYFARLLAAGETLEDWQEEGVAEYRRSLESNTDPSSPHTFVHRYAGPGTYTVTSVTINPVGYVSPGGKVYDGSLSRDDTGFDGGLTSEVAHDVAEPSDTELGSDGFRAVAGSWHRLVDTFVVQGWPEISFETFGGTPVDPVLAVGFSDYELPDDPVRDGYSFGGWFEDPDMDVPFVAGTEVRQPVTLYARWDGPACVPCTVAVVEMDGSFFVAFLSADGGTVPGGEYTVAVNRVVHNPRTGDVYVDETYVSGTVADVPSGTLVSIGSHDGAVAFTPTFRIGGTEVIGLTACVAS